MNRRMLKIILLAMCAAAVLLLSGSGYAPGEAKCAPKSAVLAALEEVAPELPSAESAVWRDAVREAPAFFFLLTAD